MSLLDYISRRRLDQSVDMAPHLDVEAIEASLIAVGYPPALAKACIDDGFSYALGLKSGAVITFSGAKDLGHGWTHLVDIRAHDIQEPNDEFASGSFSFARGMDLRLSDIAWVADAPFGS